LHDDKNDPSNTDVDQLVKRNNNENSNQSTKKMKLAHASTSFYKTPINEESINSNHNSPHPEIFISPSTSTSSNYESDQGM